MTTRLFLGSLAAGLLLATAPAAQADYESQLAANTITLIGDNDPDTLTVYNEGGLLRHNRGSDPGFDSGSDWNSNAGGEQTVASFAPGLQINVSGGGGGDSLSVGRSNVASNSAQFIFGTVEFDGGAGNDFAGIVTSGDETPRTITLTGSSLSVAGGARLEWEDSEFLTAALGPGADTIAVNGSEHDTVAALFGQGGNDTYTSAGLGPVSGPVSIVAGEGTDSLMLNEPANAGAHSYSVRDGSIERDGSGDLFLDNTLETVTLRTGADGDTITKTGTRPVTVDSGAGDDQVATRDSVADTVDCGAGTGDFALTDPLDNLVSGCDTSDRTLATPPAQPPADGGGGAGGAHQPSPPATPPAADTKAPTVTVSGLRKSVKRATFLRGVSAKVATDEPASVTARLVGSTSRVTLSRTFNLTLGQVTLGQGSGTRTVRLKPSKRLVGKARRFNVQVEVVATDAAGNRSAPRRFNLKVSR